MAVHVLSRELRALEASHQVAHTFAATAATMHGCAAGPSGAAGPGVELAQMATRLHAAQHEVSVLQEALHAATERADTLQAALSQREADLQRTHVGMVELMRQSGIIAASDLRLPHAVGG